MDSMNIHKSNKLVNNHFTKNKKEVHNSHKNCELLFFICTAYNHSTELLTELLLQLPAQRKWCHR